MALEYIKSDVKISKELCDNNPNSQNYKYHLAIAYEKLADIYIKLGNREKGQKFYITKNKIFEKLVKEYPINSDFKNTLAVSYSKLGNFFLVSKRPEEASNYFTRYHQLKKKLYLKFPENIKFKYGFALSFLKLGEVDLMKGDIDKAIINFTRYNNLMLELYNQDYNNVDYKRNLSDSYRYLGNAYKSKDWERTISYFEESLKLIIELVKEYSIIDYKNLLAEINLDFGKCYQYSKDLKNAKVYFQKAQNLWKELTIQAP